MDNTKFFFPFFEVHFHKVIEWFLGSMSQTEVFVRRNTAITGTYPIKEKFLECFILSL